MHPYIFHIFQDLTSFPETHTFFMFLSSAKNTNLLTMSRKLSPPKSLVFECAETSNTSYTVILLTAMGDVTLHVHEEHVCQVSGLERAEAVLHVEEGGRAARGEVQRVAELQRRVAWTNQR